MSNPIHVAVAAVLDNKGRVLIARRPPGVHQGGCWEFPGGKLLANEDIVSALTRELREEIGIDAHPTRPLIKFRHDYPDRSVILDVWRVEDWRGTAHGCEGQEVAWVGPNRLDPKNFPAADVPIITALRLPALYLISPEPGQDKQKFLAALETFLAAGTRLFQLRAKELPQNALGALSREALALCNRYDARFILNASPAQALSLGAHGVHLTSARLLQLNERPLDKHHWVAASCHNAMEVEHAWRIDCDFIVAAPVLPTPSHPTAQPLGWHRFEQLVSKARIPVFALGGLNAPDLARAWRAGGQGIAMINAVWNAPDPPTVIRACL